MTGSLSDEVTPACPSTTKYILFYEHIYFVACYVYTVMYHKLTIYIRKNYVYLSDMS